MDYKGYHQYIDDALPPESPYLYGLHPNAEIGFLTATSENLFKTILELQPRDSGGMGSGGQTREDKVLSSVLLYVLLFFKMMQFLYFVYHSLSSHFKMTVSCSFMNFMNFQLE